MTPDTPPTPSAAPSASPATGAPPASTSQPLAAAPSRLPPFIARLSPPARLAIAVLAVGLLGYLLYWGTYRFSHSITSDAFVEAHIVNVAPEMVSGRIVRLLVEENDLVEAGQVLAEIEPIHYRDQVEQARGKLDLAEAELKLHEAALAKLRKEVPLEIAIAEQTLSAAGTVETRARDTSKLTTDEVHKTIDESRAAVDVARSALTLAKQDYDRFTELYKLNAVALRRSQEVTQAYDAATAEVQLAGARLAKAEAARTRIEVSNADLEVARREVEKGSKALALAETGKDRIREAELLVATRQEMVNDARIALDSAEHLLAFTQVRAPFKGVVVKRYRSLGDSLSAGVPLLSMYNADLLYVTANLEETRLRGVAPGNSVTLELDAFDRPFRGRVVWINKSTGAQFALMPRNVVSGEFTKVVQRVPVRILIEKDDRWAQLRSGLSVEVCIAHGSGDAAWAAKAAQEMAAAETQFNRPAQD